MKSKCINCKHVDLKAQPKHSNNGLAPCKLLKELGVFMTLTFDRDCEKFEKATTAVLLKRKEWMDKLEVFK